MKILTKLLLIPFYLLSLSIIAQTQKGSMTVTPQILANQWSFKSTSELSYQLYVVGSSLHYYIGNQLAVGFWLIGDYSHTSAKVASVIPGWRYSIIISPELHYRFFSSRFSPYVRLRVGEIGYIRQFTDILIPGHRRTNGNLLINYPPYRSSIGMGLAYLLKNKFSLTGQLNLFPFRPDYFTNSTIGIGCQFTLN